jgi:protein RecA
MPLIKKRSTEVKEVVASDQNSDLSFITRKVNMDSVVSTGSTLLDLAISGKRRRGGGVPGGIVIEIFGPSSSGKTAILAELCTSVQLSGGSAKFLDPEARLDKEYARIYGMELSKEDYERPDTVEEVFSLIQKWNPPDPSKINIIGADSLAALSTELEVTKGDKMGMKRAKEFSTGFRKTARMITKNNWIIACTNQIRQGDYGETTPGGMAIAFYSSIRLRIKQREGIEKEIKLKDKKKLHKKTIGIESSVYVKKSSVDDPYREVPIYIIFGYGIDDIRGNLQYCKDMNENTTFICPDGKSYQSLSMAIQWVEKEGLEEKLKEQTIDLWEEIEAKFATERKPKRR